MSMTENIKFSNDLGYGSMKGSLNGEQVKIPSVVSEERSQDITTPIKFRSQAEETTYVQHFMNHLDVSINSSSVQTSSRMLIGQNAVESGLPTRPFDIADMSGKSDDDLSVILTLSVIAGKAVKDYYTNNAKLPNDQIHVNVNMATALPIKEGDVNNTRDYYQKCYTGCDHVVSINNFQNPITVHIHFSHVYVVLEGETAEFAILHANRPLARSIATDFIADYPTMAKGFTKTKLEKELTQAPNTLGIDIGEGTTDLAVFSNVDGFAKANTHASTSLDRGYGSVLDGAVEDLQSRRFKVGSRSELKDLIQAPVTPFNRSRKRMIDSAVASQVPTLTTQIVSAASLALRHAGNDINVIYVYGGGAVPMKKYLQKPLATKTTAFTGGIHIPVIFLNKDYAQYMNENGLKLVLNSMLKLDQN